jgi:hypothetical protein
MVFRVVDPKNIYPVRSEAAFLRSVEKSVHVVGMHQQKNHGEFL